MNVTRKFLLILAMGCGMVSSVARAAIDCNMVISNVGVQGEKGYMMFATSLSQTCDYQAIYIDLQTEGGKEMYAAAMSAHRQASRTC